MYLTFIYLVKLFSLCRLDNGVAIHSRLELAPLFCIWKLRYQSGFDSQLNQTKDLIIDSSLLKLPCLTNDISRVVPYKTDWLIARNKLYVSYQCVLKLTVVACYGTCTIYFETLCYEVV